MDKYRNIFVRRYYGRNLDGLGFSVAFLFEMFTSSTFFTDLQIDTVYKRLVICIPVKTEDCAHALGIFSSNRSAQL